MAISETYQSPTVAVVVVICRLGFFRVSDIIYFVSWTIQRFVSEDTLVLVRACFW